MTELFQNNNVYTCSKSLPVCSNGDCPHYVLWFKLNGVSGPLRIDVQEEFDVVISVISMNFCSWNDVAFF